MTEAHALERRYRRLLTWYPAGHRRIYGEEMIGVLMASTPVGQDRPSKADVLDLVGGGLRARIRRSRTGDGNPAWRDALAVFSVVAPVILLGWLTAGYLAEIVQQIGRPRLSFHVREPFSGVNLALLTALIATAVTIAALAVCPALARRGRRAAATTVAVIAAAAAVLGLVQAYRAFGTSDDELTLYVSIVAVMEILALIASPGPARGWQLLSRRGLAVLVAISVVAAAASTASATSFGYWDYVNTILDISGIVSVLGVALTLRWRVGRRLMALWAIPGYQFVGFAAAQYLFTRLQYPSFSAFQAEFRFLPTAVVAVLVGLAAWWSARHSRRHTPDAPG